MKKNLKHLLITGLFGLVFGLFTAGLYHLMIRQVWRPIFIAGFVLVFGILYTLLSFRLNAKRGDGYVNNDPVRRKKMLSNRKTAAVLLAVLTVCGLVFEVLYEIGGNTPPSQPTSYVFLIDCSGSMGGSDPDMKREEAIRQIMENQNAGIPYAIYTFEDRASLVKPFSVYSPEDVFSFYNGGGTDILGSVSSVLRDVKKDAGAGQWPKLIVLSDGSSSSFGLNGTARKCIRQGITVSTVGLGIDSDLLKKLAESTGGVYRYADDVSDLVNAMNSASSSAGNTKRDLLSMRAVFRLDWLYGILRVLFLLILGVVWSRMKFLLHCSSNNNENDNVFFVSLVCCTAAAFMMELLHLSPIPTWILQVLFCILWAITPGVYKDSKKISTPDLSYTPNIPSEEDPPGQTGQIQSGAAGISDDLLRPNSVDDAASAIPSAFDDPFSGSAF